MTMMTSVPMAAIDVPDRLRDIDEAWVQVLAASIEANGLEQPIVLRPGPEGRYILVAGAHRHRVAQLLEWTAIPAVIKAFDDNQARIAEIDENLMRRELSALDRAIFLLERKEVHERLHPETKHGGDRKGIKSQSLRLDQQRFTTDVADKVGLSERTVQAAIQLATNLDREAVATIRGTWIADNASALQKLAAETPLRQRNLARQIKDNGATSLDTARTRAGYQDAPLPEEAEDPQAKVYAALLAAWVKADPNTRERFLAKIKQADEVAQAKKAGAR